MQLRSHLRTYDQLRNIHDREIVQIAKEAGIWYKLIFIKKILEFINLFMKMIYNQKLYLTYLIMYFIIIQYYQYTR